ncbi:hypothetical protein EWN97_002006 [Escherichia coli]|uniref:hypothetical protein n=1 Tax=Escherichia coli TaxID=562 RepID=UPI0016BB0BC3|nr:hypothetical protein [Escherichia coli]EER9148235.1 hypothetical protein [Escherichia coli]EEU2030539.1 hypothetical protein [Escherichia coli]EEU4686345.1 hypothetical protein [Escherichia coli]EEV0711802.1 hypothetical protein [Escherichia coli]EEV7679142.1 hypothetical protein [Escherichia coli]
MSEKKQKTLPSVHSSPLDGWTCVSPMLSVGFVLTVLVATILAVCGLYRYSGEQDERIAALEGQMKTYSDALALSGSELEPFRSRLAETEKQLKSVTERLTLLEQRPVLTEEEHARTGQMAASLASLQATLAQQGETLRAYDLRLEKLEKALFTPVSPSSAKGTGTVKSTPAVTPRQKKGSSGVSVISRSAPFVLTGTEQRGGRTYAAVAPRGFTRLSDVTLLGEGESTAGWMLERAGRGEASFRVNGRQVRVMVE